MILSWQLDPVLIGSLLTFAVSYGLAVGPLRKKLAPGAVFPRKSAILFYSTLVLIYLAEGSPLHDLAEIYLFSAHMVQHLTLSYIVPPLLIAALPVWLLRPLLTNRAVLPIARTLTKPAVALLVFTLGLSIWHFPAVYEAQLKSSLIHHLEHVLFMGTSLVMWWPVMSPLPELPRLGYGTRLMYLILLPVAQVLVSAFLTFAQQPLYPSYVNAPRITSLSALADQQLGGIIMKVAGFIAFGVPLVVTFFKWYTCDSGTLPEPRQAVGASKKRSKL